LDLLAVYNQPVSPAVSEETLIHDVVPAGNTSDAPSPKSGAQKSSAGGTPTPLPVPDASSPHISTMPTQMLIAAGWNIQELGAVERSLVHFLGPIARVMVRRAARQAQDFGSLVNMLAEHLHVSAERAEFLRQNAQLATSGTGPSRMARVVDDDATVLPGYSQVRPAGGPEPTAEEVARAARLLAGYLGPIAQFLVRDAARPGVTRAAFLAGLADRLSGSDKERFLNEFEQSTL
jgi:eukaryotic-like serine/threonine-protein kinase